MNYLFFDIESASSFDGGHICSLGYVKTDSSFNILEKDDIYMNPECEFDSYVAENILAFKTSYYESFPPFSYHYERIRKLFQNCIVVGHAVDNDAYYLFNEIDREGLPEITYHFLDTSLIYMENHPGMTDTPSLKSLCEEYGLEEQEDKHQSVIDAYLTMLVFKKLSENYEISLADKKISGHVTENDIFLGNDSYFDSLDEWHNNEVYKFLLKNHFSKKDGPLKGKKICISEAYENYHYREILYIADKIMALGGDFTRNPNTCNVFVSDDSVRKKRAILERMSHGSFIDEISLDALKEMIGYQDDEIEDVVTRCEDEYYNYEDAAEYEESYTSMGDLFKDFLK